MELLLLIWLCGLLYERNHKRWLAGTITEAEYIELCKKHGKSLAPRSGGGIDEV